MAGGVPFVCSWFADCSGKQSFLVLKLILPGLESRIISRKLKQMIVWSKLEHMMYIQNDKPFIHKCEGTLVPPC